MRSCTCCSKSTMRYVRLLDCFKSYVLLACMRLRDGACRWGCCHLGCHAMWLGTQAPRLFQGLHALPLHACIGGIHARPNPSIPLKCPACSCRRLRCTSCVSIACVRASHPNAGHPIGCCVHMHACRPACMHAARCTLWLWAPPAYRCSTRQSCALGKTRS